MKVDELGKGSRVNAPNAAKAQRRKAAATCVGWRQFVQHHDGARGCPSTLVAEMTSTGESGETARHPPLRLRPRGECGIRRNLHALLIEVQSILLSKPRHTSCSYVLFASDAFPGLAQIVSHTSTRLVAKARALEARDQDLDRNLDTLPGRHPGGWDGIHEFVPRAIDERAGRGTGYPRTAYRR